MRSARFCPGCGEQLKAEGSRLLSQGRYCARCAPRFRATRFMIVASFALCLTIGYAAGRYSAPRQPFYLIGTPLDEVKNSNEQGGAAAQADANKSPARGGQQPASSAGEEARTCGAPTKSGKPCRRKVAGGGYCWQHRDKYGPKVKRPDAK
jgi:hypothetical protein